MMCRCIKPCRCRRPAAELPQHPLECACFRCQATHPDPLVRENALLKLELAQVRGELQLARASHGAYVATMKELFNKYLGALGQLAQLINDSVLTDQQARQTARTILSQLTPLTPI